MARRRAIVVVLVVLAVCVFGIWVGWRPSSSTPPQVVSTPRVRVVYLAFSTAALPIKIAQQRFAAANGIEIEMGTAAKGGLALQAVQDGVEFEATGGLGDQPWLDAVAEGHRETVAYMQLLTSVDEPFDAFIARAGTAFASVRDLKGRRVGLLASPHLRVHFDIALEAAGLTESALAGGAPLMPADHNLLLQQLRDGGVDAPEAVYTIQPFLQRELTTGRARMFSPAPLTTALNLKVMPVGTYHVNTRWLAKNGDTARRFFKAVYEAVDWMRSTIERPARTFRTSRRAQFRPRWRRLSPCRCSGNPERLTSNCIRRCSICCMSTRLCQRSYPPASCTFESRNFPSRVSNDAA